MHFNIIRTENLRRLILYSSALSRERIEASRLAEKKSFNKIMVKSSIPLRNAILKFLFYHFSAYKHKDN